MPSHARKNPNSSQTAVQTVSQLTYQLKDLLENNFPRVWVVGEISGASQASSGHVYFTLKDERAQLRAVMWRSVASRLRFEIQDGLEVVAAGPIEVYPGRGSYQLIVESLIPQGLGALELAFRQLQAKLEGEGLFDPSRKRPLPPLPQRIALVTSPTGAAVRDMLQIFARRWPAVPLVLVPVPVQGEGAAARIAAGIVAAARLPDVDLIIVGRGGGSLEDLWAFNEEVVARAIASSPVPVISAVGHEVDVSIADLVADRRALTPSDAAMISVPDRAEFLAGLQQLQKRLVTSLRQQALRGRMRLESLSSRRVLTRPFDQLHERAALVDEYGERMRRGMRRSLEGCQQRVALLANSLDALSPLRVLARGYSITRLKQSGELVRSSDQLRSGDEVETTLASGRVVSRVESVLPSDNV